MADLFDDFDTEVQCEEFYTEEDTFFCNEEVDGVCNGCGTCNYDDEESGPSWEQEWEDFGEVGCESIEYL